MCPFISNGSDKRKKYPQFYLKSVKRSLLSFPAQMESCKWLGWFRALCTAQGFFFSAVLFTKSDILFLKKNQPPISPREEVSGSCPQGLSIPAFLPSAFVTLPPASQPVVWQCQWFSWLISPAPWKVYSLYHFSLKFNIIDLKMLLFVMGERKNKIKSALI